MATQKPKIITSSPAIHRDCKTLVVYTLPSELNERLMRIHNSIITNLTTYDAYSKILEKQVNILLTDVNELSKLTMIKSHEQYFKNVSIFVLTTNTFNYLQTIIPNFTEFALNLVVLDNIHEHFSYIFPWNGTIIDAVSIISIIHGNQVIQMNNCNEEMINSAKRASCQKFIPISPLPEFWMFTQFYKPKEKSREIEINETLKLNTDCDFVDKIVIFLEKEEHREDIRRLLAKKPRSALAKIRFVSLLHRLTYSDFFNYVISAEVPENTYVALTNADIYFDNSIANIWSISMDNRMLALLRYEHSDDGPMKARLFGPRPDSQDTWIFSAASIKQRNWNTQQLEKFNYQLGIPGCDNSFTTDMIREKFFTVNPAGTIRTYHYHSSRIRNYTQKDVLWRPIYIYITPSAITDLEQINNFNTSVATIPTNNKIHIQSNSEIRAQTYCTMLARAKRYVWNTGENIINKKFQVFELQKVVSCSCGILFDTFKLYTGNQDESCVSEYLRTANINQLNKTVTIENFISVPINSKNIYNSKAQFILEYITPLLFILKNVPSNNVYSFFWPEKFNELLKFIEFPVKARIIPVVDNINFYSEKCWAIMPGSFQMSVEAINIFKSSWKLESIAPSTNIMTLVDNDKLFSIKNESFIKNLDNILSKYGWELNIMRDCAEKGIHFVNEYSKLAQSDGIIFWNDVTESQEIQTQVWRSIWNMKPGSAFLEFQNEFKLSGEAQQLAAACGLDSRIFILQKADDNYLHGLVLKYVEEYVQTHSKNNDEIDQEMRDDDSSQCEEVSLNLNV
jgi:hypothetical protein